MILIWSPRYHIKDEPKQVAQMNQQEKNEQISLY